MDNEEAKQRFFTKVGFEVMSQFQGASVKDLIEFSDKLKEWALVAELQPIGVDRYLSKSEFFISKLE